MLSLNHLLSIKGGLHPLNERTTSCYSACLPFEIEHLLSQITHYKIAIPVRQEIPVTFGYANKMSCSCELSD